MSLISIYQAAVAGWDVLTEMIPQSCVQLQLSHAVVWSSVDHDPGCAGTNQSCSAPHSSLQTMFDMLKSWDWNKQCLKSVTCGVTCLSVCGHQWPGWVRPVLTTLRPSPPGHNTVHHVMSLMEYHHQPLSTIYYPWFHYTLTVTRILHIVNRSKNIISGTGVMTRAQLISASVLQCPQSRLAGRE